MNLIFLGPPGSGKGTQSVKLAKAHGLIHISTGDVLREAIKNQTELGKQAEGYMNRGELVPDQLIVGLIESKIKNGEIASGFILDGFPRTIPQAEALDVMLKENGVTLNKALLLAVGNEEVISRISGRRFCSVCGAGYNVNVNVESLEPKVENICDNDGAELIQREDDDEATVINRLEVYTKQTKPLEDYYRKQSILVEIDAKVAPEIVFESLLAQVS